jgi:DNA polymerase III delta prime subunit
MQYSVGKYARFIVIDEADRMGHDCQEVLTSLIEKYPKTRTIWTLNDIDNIMDRIVDRASGGVFEFKKPEPKQIVSRLRQIAKSEKVRIDEEKLKEIAKNAPSVRNAIGMLQQECTLAKAVEGRRK